MSKGATTTTAEVPDYLKDLYTEASTRGLEAADIPFQPYTGEMVAGFTPDQMQAMQATRGLFGQAMALDPRSNLAALARQGTPTVQAASLLDTDIARYQDPYTEQVLEPALADIQRRQDMEQQRAQSRAIKAGAFGGSRSALIESEATRPFAEEAAQTIAGLRSAGFGQALNMAERDAARRQQATMNQANLELRARQQQAGLLGGELGEQYRTLGLLSGIGGQQQVLDQARLQAQRAEFERELGFPAYQLGLLQAASGQISPAVIGQRTQKETGLGDILATGAGLAAAAFTGGLAGGGGGGASGGSVGTSFATPSGTGGAFSTSPTSFSMFSGI